MVYRIPCSCGQEYIGETRRSLESRLKEHQAATRRGETEKSAVAEHAWTHQHRPLWDETAILDQARSNSTLLIKEAFYILTAEREKLLNRDQGLQVSECWRPVLRRLLHVHTAHAQIASISSP